MIEVQIQNHRERAFMAALAILRDPEDASDAVQEATCRGLAAQERYDSSKPFYPWFHRIVKNYCLDLLAARKRHREVADPEPVLAGQAGSDETDRHLAVTERDAALHRALDTLAPAHREIIELRHFEDLSYDEMAEVLDVAVGTVMSRLYRARKALQQALENDPQWSP